MRTNFFEKVGISVVAFLAFAVLLLVVGLLIGFPLKWLWNWLMPVLFNLKEISFWQALGLYVLAGLLTKGSLSTSTKSK